MAEPNMLRLAKKGDPKAIAAMLNRSLRAKHIVAQVNRQDDCLQVLVESEQIPNQKAIVSFIRQGLTNLGIKTIKTVQVYGRQQGQESLAWKQSFEIESSPPQVTDVQDSDPDFHLPQTPPDVKAENDLSSRSSSPDLEPPLGSNFAQVPRHASTGGYTSSHNRQTSAHSSHRSTQSSHSQPRQPLKPLSVGNVVSAGLRLYRDRFKLYFGLAFQAFLWILVPIYGWAKSYQIQGIISRHAVSEFAEQPETIDRIRTQLNPKMWDFWIAQLLIGLISFGVNFALSILSGLLVGIPTMIVATVFPDNLTLVAILNVLGLVINVVTLFIYIWVYSHFFIAELPLAVEPGMSSTSCLNRSWELTKGLVIQITGVITVAFVITIPLGVLASIPIMLIIPSLFMAPSPAALIASLGVLIPLTFIMIILTGLLAMPFWQIIKAVIYYDLRNRREGMDLQLRH